MHKYATFAESADLSEDLFFRVKSLFSVLVKSNWW